VRGDRVDRLGAGRLEDLAVTRFYFWLWNAVAIAVALKIYTH
jgi:hypothetical protein